jgi:hypothetical protein
MSEGIWIAVIGASGVTLAALIPIIYSVVKDRNAARAAAMQKARDEGYAQARSEAVTQEANTTIRELKREIAAKDTALADSEQARAELRQALMRLREGVS